MMSVQTVFEGSAICIAKIMDTIMRRIIAREVFIDTRYLRITAKSVTECLDGANGL